jgi:hypothetical protein
MKVTSLRKNFYSRKWIDDFKIQVTPEDLGMGFIVSFIIDWGNDKNMTQETIDTYFREWGELEKFCALINKDIGYLNMSDMELYKLLLERKGYIKRTVTKKFGQAMFIAILHMKYEEHGILLYPSRKNKKKVRERRKIEMKRKEVEKLKQKEIELLEKIKEYDEETYKELIKECY